MEFLRNHFKTADRLVHHALRAVAPWLSALHLLAAIAASFSCMSKAPPPAVKLAPRVLVPPRVIPTSERLRCRRQPFTR